MQTVSITAQQTAVMFLLMGCGYFLYRMKLITQDTSRTLANILVWLVIPSVMMQSLYGKYSQQNLGFLAASTLLAALALGLSILTARLCFRSNPIEHFGTAFSNSGFMGIPLVTAVLGEDAVFLITAFIVILNLLQWTYGIHTLTGGHTRFEWKTFVLNPIVIGVFLGLFFFFSRITLPAVLIRTIDYTASLNTPIAMLVLGVYLAQSDLKSLFISKRLYLVGLVRLLIIPVLTFLLFCLLPFPARLRMAVFIVSAAPVGVNVAIYSQLNGLDYTYACKTVTLSTLLSILTLPLLTGLAGACWQL